MLFTSFIFSARLCNGTIAVPSPILEVFIISTAFAALIVIALAANIKPSGNAFTVRQLRKQRTRLMKAYKAKKLLSQRSVANNNNFSHNH